MINKELYKFCGKTKKYIYFAVIINLLRLGFSIAFAYIFADLIVNILRGVDLTFISIFAVIIIVLMKTFFTKVSAKFNFTIVREVKSSLRDAIYGKALNLGMSYQSVLTTQEVTHLGVEGVEQLENYYGGYLTHFYYCLTSSVFLFLAMFPLDKLSAFILLIGALSIPLSLQLIMGLVKKVQRKYWKKYADVGNLFLDSLTGITTLKIFEADEKRAEEMDEKAETFRKQTMRVLTMQLNSIVIIDWIAYVSTAVVIGMNVMKFAKGETSLFYVVSIIVLVSEFFVPMRTLTGLFHVAMTGVAAGEKILDFLEYEDEREFGNREFPENAVIEVKNLDFSYPDGTEVLKNLNLKFDSGKFTALVGRSGCGKSTLASLICGQIKNSKGIFYSGINKGELLKGTLEKSIVRITHTPHIFAASVRDNILMGKKDVSDEKIIEVLKSLNLWAFLEGDRGLDTKLLQGGKNISGGQAQRISIARALISDFQVYIFDEATSNVDVESENVIIEIIKEIAKKRTVIYISHKMNVVSTADYVHVLKDGEAVQSGTPIKLLEEDGLYKDLYIEQDELCKAYISVK